MPTETVYFPDGQYEQIQRVVEDDATTSENFSQAVQELVDDGIEWRTRGSDVL